MSADGSDVVLGDGAPSRDATIGADGSAPPDAGDPDVTVIPPSDAIAPPEATPWTFVNAVIADSANVVPRVATVADDVVAGDLVILAIGSSENAGAYTYTIGPAERVAFATVTSAPTNTYTNNTGYGQMTGIAWGTAQSSGPLSVTVTATNNGASMTLLDVTMSHYRGGSPIGRVVDHATNWGGPASAIHPSCTSIASVKNGLAYWIVSAWGSTGAAASPAWVQRSSNEGNPTGDVSPTDGSPLPAMTFTDNSNPTGAPLCSVDGDAGCFQPGDWQCLVVSFAP